MTRMNRAALLWGFAEATLFFLVPDVLLSYVAVRNLRESFPACGWALLGAVLGGGAMYLWGWTTPAGAATVLDFVPAISPAMVDGVEASLAEDGLWALFLGPVKGVPYKIYAVKAGALHLSAAGFLLVSLPARLMRFVLVMLLVSGLSQSVFRWTPLKYKYAVLTTCWVLFYAGYFWLTPS